MKKLLMERCHKLWMLWTLQNVQVAVHVMSSSCTERARIIWYLICFLKITFAEKKADEAPLSRFGGHCADCKKTGSRAGCNHLVQRLLFNEDSEDADLVQSSAKNSQFSPASLSTKDFCQEINAQNKGSSNQWVSLMTIILKKFLWECIFIQKYIVCFSGQTVTYRRKTSPCFKHKSDTNTEADTPLNVSRDYILFSPTCIAAAMKKAKFQQSLQNQSASVLTAPSGLNFSSLNDITLPQPGESILYVIKYISLQCVVWTDNVELIQYTWFVYLMIQQSD